MKILLIGFSRSSHLQSWIKQIDKEFELYFIESTSHGIDKKKFSDNFNEHVHFFETRYDLFLNFLKSYKLVRKILNTLILKIDQRFNLMNTISAAIKKHNFDYIHYFEFQHAGYGLSQTLEHTDKTNFKIIGTNFGSDIFWFKESSHHFKMITTLLNYTDILISESKRDIDLAKKLGYKNKNILVNSNSGGVTLKNFCKVTKNSSAKNSRIFFKGNFGFVGRPFLILDALVLLRDYLIHNNIQVIGVSISPEIINYFKQEFDFYGIKTKLFEPLGLSRDETIRYLHTARTYIGVSLSDGLCTTAIEAMASKTFIIQSISSTIDEHIERGVDYFPFDPILNSVEDLSKLILESLENDKLVFRAIEKNYRYALKNFKAEEITRVMSNIYI